MFPPEVPAETVINIMKVNERIRKKRREEKRQKKGKKNTNTRACVPMDWQAQAEYVGYRFGRDRGMSRLRVDRFLKNSLARIGLHRIISL